APPSRWSAPQRAGTSAPASVRGSFSAMRDWTQGPSGPSEPQSSPAIMAEWRHARGGLEKSRRQNVLEHPGDLDRLVLHCAGQDDLLRAAQLAGAEIDTLLDRDLCTRTEAPALAVGKL